MKISIIIDRVEKDFIVVELPTGQLINVPIALIPDATEGSTYSIEKDDGDMQTRSERIQKKAEELFRD